jgi:2-polyprenyl-6-hydroxyphenyl methylase/3-demethylubiquinone-9 3-methyltransferase
MEGYYAQRLSAERLRRCYEVAPPRVKRYLEAEVDFLLARLSSSDRVLELGCGYGRILQRLLVRPVTVVGIDTSVASLRLARNEMTRRTPCHLVAMDASELGFRSGSFDVVACLQNGISAFKVNQRALIEEAIRVTRQDGTVLFSSYAERFWEDRLAWFEIQSAEGLLGDIDYQATGGGTIVCRDGFRATTVGPNDFHHLTEHLAATVSISEVDGSSIFCELRVGQGRVSD